MSWSRFFLNNHTYRSIKTSIDQGYTRDVDRAKQMLELEKENQK
jgi:hypothetical protein